MTLTVITIRGGLTETNSGIIDNCTVNVNISEGGNVGGLVGTNDSGTISNCITTGSITALNGSVGGLVGESINGKISNLYSSCSIIGKATNAGGIIGYAYSINNIQNCGFYGGLTDLKVGNCGGIIGYSSARHGNNSNIKNCYNNSTINVSVSNSLGGIIGAFEDVVNAVVQNCYNKSAIINTYKDSDSNSYSGTGGVIGHIKTIDYAGDNCTNIDNCYNLGNVDSMTDFVGGLIGMYQESSGILKVNYCYSKGSVTNTNVSYAGGLVGHVGSFYYGSYTLKFNFEDCVFLGNVAGKTANAIAGEGGSADNFTNIFYNKDLSKDSQKYGYGLTTDELKDKESYLYWDFDTIWDINENYNDGYPYLRELGINTSGVELNKSSLNMLEEDTYKLTAEITPSNASNKNVMWISSDKTVASVDQKGTVTAVAEGTAKITAVTLDGGYTSECAITVKDKDYTQKVVTLSAGDAVGVPGRTIKIPVSIKNNTGISSFGINIIYDNRYLTPTEVIDGELFKDSIKNLNYLDNAIRVTYAGASNTAGDVILFYIVFNVKENIENANCEIEIKPDQIKALEGNSTINVEYMTQFGNIQIKNIILGDVDGDGEVTAADATLILRNYAALIEFTETQKSSGDVDGDGEVTAADATQVLFKFAGYPVEW